MDSWYHHLWGLRGPEVRDLEALGSCSLRSLNLKKKLNFFLFLLHWKVTISLIFDKKKNYNFNYACFKKFPANYFSKPSKLRNPGLDLAIKMPFMEGLKKGEDEPFPESILQFNVCFAASTLPLSSCCSIYCDQNELFSSSPTPTGFNKPLFYGVKLP